MSIVGLIVFLIILGVAFWAVRALSAAFGIPPPIVTVIYVILVILAVVWLLNIVGMVGGAGGLKLR
jgi:hypothetical protein